MEDFRAKMMGIGHKALQIMDDYFDGKATDDPERIKHAVRMIGASLKVEHMNQVQDISRKSQALRLIKYLPNDETLRQTYIVLTNPETRPLLLDRPK